MTKNTHFVRRFIEMLQYLNHLRSILVEGIIEWLIGKLSLHGHFPLDLIVHISRQ